MATTASKKPAFGLKGRIFPYWTDWIFWMMDWWSAWIILFHTFCNIVDISGMMSSLRLRWTKVISLLTGNWHVKLLVHWTTAERVEFEVSISYQTGNVWTALDGRAHTLRIATFIQKIVYMMNWIWSANNSAVFAIFSTRFFRCGFWCTTSSVRRIFNRSSRGKAEERKGTAGTWNWTGSNKCKT